MRKEDICMGLMGECEGKETLRRCKGKGKGRCPTKTCHEGSEGE
jgi:hypothetical protein